MRIRTLLSYVLEHTIQRRLTLHSCTIIWIAFDHCSWLVLILRVLRGDEPKDHHLDLRHFITLLLSTMPALYTCGYCGHLVLAYIGGIPAVVLLVISSLLTMHPVNSSANFLVTLLFTVYVSTDSRI